MKNICITFLILILLLSCHKTSKIEKIFSRSEILMDTIVTIKVVDTDENHAEKAINKVFSELKKLEYYFDNFDPKSDISRINRQAGIKAVNVSDDTIKLLTVARKITNMSNGAFDISVGVITSLYDFHKKILPDINKIKDKLSYVNYKDIIVKPFEKTVYLKRKGMKIDPGGIVKGYAADKAVEVLMSQEISAAIVAIAGDIRAFGKKPNGDSWKVGIRDPRSKELNKVFAVVELNNMAISTSGDYERYFIKNGVRYHHIINPKTGMPATKGLISVTVIGPLGRFTDPFATAIFIMGKNKGTEMAEKAGYGTVIVDKNGNIFVSNSVKDIIHILYMPHVMAQAK